MNPLRYLLPVLVAGGVGAFSSAAQADTASCADGRCSTAEARLRLEGKDPLRTSIDTGWMPSCDGGVEHCNKGLQIRADIALTAITDGGNLFTADMPRNAVVRASWENPGYLELRTDSLAGNDSILTVTHSLTPQVELYLDIGPVEQGWTFPATRLLQLIPGSHFEYAASASASFSGWAFDGASVTVPAPPLQNARLFSVELDKLSDVVGKVMHGSLSLHAQTSPTVTYKTTKVVVGGHELSSTATTQIPFPAGDYDFLEMPATIEADLTAKGDLDVLPAATVSSLGDMNFSPPMTITFSSVKVTKHYEGEVQKYAFPDKTIRIPLPNVHRPLEGLDGGQVTIGGEGTVPVILENTGESQGLVRLESSDPRFVVPAKPVTLSPKSKGPMNITFRPDAPGHAEAIITAHTNDPDSPELTFKITADGVLGPAQAPGKPGEGTEPSGDSGCGCKTAGTSTSRTGTAGIGAIALGLAALIRRRRR